MNHPMELRRPLAWRLRGLMSPRFRAAENVFAPIAFGVVNASVSWHHENLLVIRSVATVSRLA